MKFLSPAILLALPLAVACAPPDGGPCGEVTCQRGFKCVGQGAEAFCQHPDAFAFAGPYPKPARIAFTDRADERVEVIAYPGLVVVLPVESATLADVRAKAAILDAEVVASVPEAGMFW